MKKFGLPSVCVAICSLFALGCSSTARGPDYLSTKYYSSPVESGKARVFVFRKADGMAAAARSTRLLLDGKRVGKCDIDGFFSFDVTAGEHLIAADVPDTAGKCSVKITMESGKKYYFEVKPRPINGGVVVAGLAGGAIGSVVADNIANSGLECGGMFSIRSASEAYGERSLINTNFSK